MRNAIIFITLFSLVLASCGNDDLDPSNNLDDGIDPSDKEMAGMVEGNIVNQNNGPKKTYLIDSAFVTETTPESIAYLYYDFQGEDSLTLTLWRVTSDYNYHTPVDSSQNSILFAELNGDTLEMIPSAVSIQPRPEFNAYHVVLNLHTVANGDFNGTADSVIKVNY